jgi:4-oxalocrotonate tautomerase
MPYVSIEIAGRITKDQKSELAEQITEIIKKVTGKPSQYTYVVFKEVEKENWAIGGKLLQ